MAALDRTVLDAQVYADDGAGVDCGSCEACGARRPGKRCAVVQTPLGTPGCGLGLRRGVGALSAVCGDGHPVGAAPCGCAPPAHSQRTWWLAVGRLAAGRAPTGARCLLQILCPARPLGLRASALSVARGCAAGRWARLQNSCGPAKRVTTGSTSVAAVFDFGFVGVRACVCNSRVQRCEQA